MAGKDQPKNQTIGRTGLITFQAGISGLQSAGVGTKLYGCLPNTLKLKLKLSKKLKES